MKEMASRSWPFLAVVLAMFAWIGGLQIGCNTQLLGDAGCQAGFKSAFSSYFPMISFITGIILAVNHGWDKTIVGSVIGFAMSFALIVGVVNAVTAETASGHISTALAYAFGFSVVFLCGVGGGLFFLWGTGRGKRK